MFYFQKFQFGTFWRAMEWKMLVYVFYDHLEYFTATWCILWQFGTVCGHLVYFSWFDILNSYM
jgi:hypothetical protein